MTEILPEVAVVILAGGEGRRIGGSKPLRSLAGQSLLERALAHARSWSGRVAIAVRDEEQVGDCDAPAIPDEPGVEGPLAGLIAGLKFARGQNCTLLLTIPADMPFLPTDLLDRLAAALTPDAGAALASSGGHVHPVCGLWRVPALEAVADYLATGRRSLKGLAALVGAVAVDWTTGPVDPFFNVNDSGDLAEAERLLRC